AVVPPAATTGKISVTTSGGAATSAALFTVTSASPFVGVFSGTFNASSAGLTGPCTLVIGANGVAGASFLVSGKGYSGFSRGTANLTTGLVRLTELSTGLTGLITASVQLRASGAAVTGSGTVTECKENGTNCGAGTITITSR